MKAVSQEKITIKLGNEGDCQTALTIIHSAFAKYKGRLVPESSSFWETVETLQKKLKDHTLVLAEIGGEIIGCVFYHEENNRDLYFHRLAVLPAYQNRGAAKKLIEFVEAQARRLNCPRVTLQVRIALEQNIRFFRSLGYEITSSGMHEGFNQPTWYEMAKPID